MNKLITAILNDDATAARKLLAVDAGLATRLIRTPKLYRDEIFHWIYAGDTALHLAAAGYRTKIVRLLIDACADPNAAGNHRSSDRDSPVLEGLAERAGRAGRVTWHT